MSSIKIYGVGASRTFRNLWMLHELGLKFEHDPIHYTDPKLKQPPYSDLNPNARVPFLSIDNYVISESLAINLYLAQRFPGPLTPSSIESQALATQYSLWAATTLEQPIMDWAMNALVKPEPERDLSLATTSLKKLEQPFAALEKQLNHSPYLLGTQFTVADVNVASVMYRCLWLSMPKQPKTTAWLQNCLGRDAALIARRARGEAV